MRLSIALLCGVALLTASRGALGEVVDDSDAKAERARKKQKEKERKRKMRRLQEKTDAYKKPELSESKDMCKQCEFVVGRLANHLLAAADEKEMQKRPPSREQWLKRFRRYCEPMDTPACLKFISLYGGLLADELADLSLDVRELGADEPSVSNAALRARLCDDVTETCQKHHNVIRKGEIALVVRNALKKQTARLFWLTKDDDGVVTALVPESMSVDHVILPGDRVRLEAKRGHHFVVLPDGVDEQDAPRLVVRPDGPEEQIFELRKTDSKPAKADDMAAEADSSAEPADTSASSGADADAPPVRDSAVYELRYLSSPRGAGEL